MLRHRISNEWQIASNKQIYYEISLMIKQNITEAKECGILEVECKS